VSNVILSSDGAYSIANVGTYTVVPSSASGNGLGNYNITYNSTGNYTVVSSNLVLKAGNQTKAVGSSLNIGTTCFTLTGSLYNGDTISDTTLTSQEASNASVAVGLYNITSSTTAGLVIFS
jgi:hypothetical protein